MIKATQTLVSLHVILLAPTKFLHAQLSCLESLPSQVFLTMHLRSGLAELHGRLLHLFLVNAIKLVWVHCYKAIDGPVLRRILIICCISSSASYTCFWYLHVKHE